MPDLTAPSRLLNGLFVAASARENAEAYLGVRGPRATQIGGRVESSTTGRARMSLARGHGRLVFGRGREFPKIGITIAAP